MSCRKGAGRSGLCWLLWRDDVLPFSPNGARGREAEGRDGVGRAGCCGVTTFLHFFPMAHAVVRQRGGTEWAVLAPVA